MELEVGSKAPAFNLPDENGKNHKLSDYKGKWVLVYFYPKDDTPGCTVEACSFRDNLPRLKKTDAVILGISADSVESHKKFAEKHELPFTLLADESKEVVKKYGVWQAKKLFGRSYFGIKRMSFLVDPQGMIAVVYKTVRPTAHAEQVLGDLKKLS